MPNSFRTLSLRQIEAAARNAPGKVDKIVLPDLNDVHICALDLGRRIGYAISTPEYEFSGFHELTAVDHAGGPASDGERFMALSLWLTDMQNFYTFSVIAFEDVHPSTHVSSRQTQLYSGYRAILMAWCALRHITVVPLSVGTIKKAATGKGNSKKPEVIKAVSELLGTKITDDNEADAVAAMMTLYKSACTVDSAAKAVNSSPTRKRRVVNGTGTRAARGSRKPAGGELKPSSKGSPRSPRRRKAA